MDARIVALLAGSLALAGLLVSALLVGVDGIFQSRWTLIQAGGLLLGGSLLVASSLLDAADAIPSAFDSSVVAGMAHFVLAAGVLGTVGAVGRDPVGIGLSLVAVWGCLWFLGFGLLHVTQRRSPAPTPVE